MVIDRAKTARGALAGAVAAGVWAAQQPLDKTVFGVDYDDTELLGKAVTRGRGVAGRRLGAAPRQRRGRRRGLRDARAADAAAVVVRAARSSRWPSTSRRGR